jgi:hypothetical protein
MPDKCGVCHRTRWATSLYWVCKRCEETAQGVATGEASGESEIVIMPRARRPFRQLFSLALLLTFAVIGETLILVFH